MISKSQWSAFDDIVSNSSSQEHCNQLLTHVQRLKAHMNASSFKNISKTCVQIFCKSFETMTKKLFLQSELAKIQDRLLKKMSYTRQFITNIIAAKRVLKKSIESLLNRFSKKFESVIAVDFEIKIKHVSQNVRKHLKSMQSSQIFKKINDHIKRDFDILKIQKFSNSSNISNDSWKFRAIVFRHMRSDDVIISIRKNEDKMFFSRFIKWIQMFDINAKVHIEIFEILMHSVWVKSMQIKITNRITRIIETLTAENSVRLKHLRDLKDIRWIEWLKKPEKNKQTNLILELAISKQTNEIIKKSIIWNEETHACEKRYRNASIKQCFNCWAYDHTKIQCHSIIKCDLCAKSDHKTKKCSMSKTKIICINCENSHIFMTKQCMIKKKKLKKIKVVKAVTFLFYSERSSTSTKDFFFSSSNTLFLFDSSSERDELSKNQKFKNSEFKNIELINLTITTTISTILTTLMIIISISSINHSEKSQITEAQLVTRSAESVRNVSSDWRLSSSISEKKHQLVTRSAESAKNVNIDWQLNLISQMKEKNQKTLRDFSDQIIQQIQSIINFMLSSTPLFRKRKIMISIISENIFSTSHLRATSKRTIKTIEKAIKNIRIANAKAKKVKTKEIERILEKDNAMINAQINNDTSEIIFEIAIQNSNQISLAIINASRKKFEIDVSFIEKTIFSFNERNTINETNRKTNQSSMNQMISYMTLEIATSVNITKSFSEDSSNSIRQTQCSNAIVIDQQHRRSNCSSHNFSKKLKKNRDTSTFKVIKKLIKISTKKSRRSRWAQKFKTSIENWLYCNTMCTRQKI